MYEMVGDFNNRTLAEWEVFPHIQSSMLSIAKFMKAEQQMSMNRASALVGAVEPSISACLIPPASLV
ncbi:hypothetical protein D3C81_2298820 [compost metagenome]